MWAKVAIGTRIFIGDQGTGKGVILGNLLIKIFDKLGIHCTNFGSVTNEINPNLEFKSFVLVFVTR